MPLEVIERALEDISDGNPVDWNLLESGARDEDEREQLRWLRVLDQMAGLHRSVNDSLDEDSIRPDLVRRPSKRPSSASSATWGRYQLLEKIGEGSFGSVHCAWDPQLESELAIKILHPVATDERLKARLLREGRALAKVSHPNIVKVLNVEAHEGRIGLCMEFVRGQTLDELVRTQGPLSSDDALAVGRDVCAALAAVHGAGFVHRDIKARNVMREQNARIVLMDFGAGREAVTEPSARRSDMTGTPLYMAPELLAGTPASACSDVYSVGVLLYHLVTGEYPVQAQTLDALRTAHRAGDRRFLSDQRPDLPRSFVLVVEQALAANPEERYADGNAILAALESVPRRGEAMPILATKFVAVPFYATVLCSVVGAFGFLSSYTFNEVFERTDFDAETMWQWPIWGIRSTVLPLTLLALLLMVAWFAASFLIVPRRVLTRWSSRAARIDQSLRLSTAEFIHRFSLHDASLLLALVLMLSSTALIVSWWYFWPLLQAFGVHVSTSPPEQLALLGPALASQHDFYREVFTFVFLLTAGSWYPVLKLAARRGQRVSRGALLGVAAVTLLALGSLQLPYRLLRHNEFETAKWDGKQCYITGERTEDLLLFCPELQPPRNRIVQKKTKTVERLRLRENIFTRFSLVPGRIDLRPATSTIR